MRSCWVRLAQPRTLVRSISSIQPAAFGGVTGEQDTVMVFTSSGRVAASIITLIPPLFPPTTCTGPNRSRKSFRLARGAVKQHYASEFGFRTLNADLPDDVERALDEVGCNEGFRAMVLKNIAAARRSSSCRSRRQTCC